MTPTPNVDRLLPYAKDHDRLQLALLYIEAESNLYKYVQSELASLRRDQDMILQSLKGLAETREERMKGYVHERHPANYIDSTGHTVVANTNNQATQTEAQREGWHDPVMERVFMMERCEMKALDRTLKNIEVVEAQQEESRSRIGQREEILKLIEELHATAFDGDTPEFPHEDRLEALVKVAEAGLEGEQAILSKLYKGDGLVELATTALSISRELVIIARDAGRALITTRRSQISLSGCSLIEFEKYNIEDRCDAVARKCDEWVQAINGHISEHPNATLSLTQELRGRIPSINSGRLTHIFYASVFGNKRPEYEAQIPKLIREIIYVKDRILVLANATAVKNENAEIFVTKAKTLLELRRRQLVAARSQILDHIVDPENCPPEQPADELPEYPEEILIHDLPVPHPSVSRLLEQSETYPRSAYVQDIVKSRLNRARRTTHPPVLLPGRYQAPTYDELEDPQLLRSHFQRDVPPTEGDAPEYSEELDYEDVIEMEPSEVGPTIQQELNKLISEARGKLGLGLRVPREQLEEQMRAVRRILTFGGVGIPISRPRRVLLV